MNSNNEEYLDSLLNSAQKSNNNNPQSALSRMSSRNGSSGNGPGDIGDLLDNSNGGNSDLNDIGRLLDQLDSGELVDDRMADLLDDIARPTSSSVPTFTVGGTPTSQDVRDPEEIALDEAIANAEKMDAEILSGKLDLDPGAASSSIVDLEEGDDALLEMAPEVSLPEDNQIIIEKEANSDADQTPEEILTDLLDDMPDENLMNAGDNANSESLSDVLDNLKDDADEEPASEDVPSDMALEEPVLEEPIPEEPIPEEAAPAEPDADIPNLEDLSALESALVEEPTEEAPQEAGSSDELNLDELSLDALESEMEQLVGADALSAEDEASLGSDTGLDELAGSGFTFDGGSGLDMPESGESADGASLEGALEEGAIEEAAFELPTEDGASAETPAEEASPEKPKASEASLDDISEDDFNLDALEASLDDLLGSDETDTSQMDGEVAALAEPSPDMDASSKVGEDSEVSMQDLDALMNSLAGDEIEDIESTAHIDEENGHAEESEIPKEDILDALTEDGFGDEGAGEPSLDDLASIPERGSSSSSDDDDEEASKGKKGKKAKKEKKEKKPGLFARLLAALVKEDEEPEASQLANLTDENQQVLNELGDGDDKGKKEKKPKKEKKKKEKKPKKEKPPKEKKPPKPKKEKKPKPPKDPGEPEKAISPKKVAISGLFAASLGVLVIIPALVLPDRIASERAQTAYEHNEYTTAYKMLYGKEMTEDETIIYEQSRVLAWANRYMDGYQNYTAMNMKEEALDMLLMAMRNRDDLIAEAAKYSVEIEVNSVYDSIESLLTNSYGLTEAEVLEINSIKKDRDYTIRLMEIVGTLES